MNHIPCWTFYVVGLLIFIQPCLFTDSNLTDLQTTTERNFVFCEVTITQFNNLGLQKKSMQNEANKLV